MADLPAGFDTAVIGGGLVGCAVAWSLVGRGIVPAVVARGGPGGDGDAPVLVRAWDHTAPPERSRLGLEGAARFEPLQDRIGRFGYARIGGLAPAFGADEAEAGKALAAAAAASGLPVVWLTKDEALQREPALPPALLGATWSSDDCVVNPSLMCRRLAGAAAHEGAAFFHYSGHVAVRRSGGQFTVRAGSRQFEARRLVLASGDRIAEVGRQLGLALELDADRGHLVLTERLASLLRHVLPGAWQQPTGEVVLDHRLGGGTGCEAALRVIRGAAQHAAHLVPGLATARIVRTVPWTAHAAPGGRPVVGRAADGVYVAACADVAAVPVLAEAAAEIIAGGRPRPEWEAWAPAGTRAHAGAASGGQAAGKDSPDSP